MKETIINIYAMLIIRFSLTNRDIKRTKMKIISRWEITQLSQLNIIVEIKQYYVTYNLITSCLSVSQTFTL